MSAPLSVYTLLGEEKIHQLVDHFYEEVERTPDLRKLYPKDLEPARQRLYWFLLHVFGGPATYLEKRGHPMLRRRHFQWAIDPEMRDRWLGCMGKALDQIPMEAEAREAISTYFFRAAQHMVNRHPPEGG
jgi:hemoglobin